VVVFAITWNLASLTTKDTTAGERCFCQLKGELDDCSCKVESVDSFNNLKVFPRLNSLLEKDFFRYWKVNLLRDCPFWKDNRRCASPDCAVDGCKEEQLPDSIKKNHSGHKNKYSEEANTEGQCAEESGHQEGSLGNLDTTISDESKKAFESWKKHDDAQDRFCEIDDEDSADAMYYDLLLNPERFTGYRGEPANRIWRSIYNENCFQPERTDYTNYLTANKAMCLEKRVFYRMVSGLHSSINLHLSAMYLTKDPLGVLPSKWGPNLEQFKSRFDPEMTNGEGPQRLRNLYFTYLVELRALAKVAPYLKKELFYTGNDEVDNETREAVSDLLDILRDFPDHFDESQLFRGDPKEAAALKEEFRLKFMNISRIMDCVGCDKCRLWGKLQITGMGTALKILFSGDDIGPESIIAGQNGDKKFQLLRLEIVSLFNAFGRLSKSIREVENFRNMLS